MLSLVPSTLGLVLERPAGLALLALPLLLWLFLRRREEPRLEATGLLTLWRELAAGDVRAAEGGARRLTPRAWWLVTALLLGALAVSGPRPERPPRLESYELVVDRSPSMYLPLAAAGGRRRYDAALEAALTWLDDQGVADEARRWTSAGADAVRGARPPAAWSEPPAFPAPELEPAGFSAATFLTDRRQDHAGGQFVSGGAAIAGPIGEAAGRAIVWDGAALVEGEALPPRRVAINPRLAPRLRRLVEFWCAERGHTPVSPGGGPPSLSLRTPEGEARAVEAEGVDWSLVGRSVGLAEGPGVWLVDLGGAPLVRAVAPGVLEVGLLEITRLGGDPASFAVAWGELLDASLPPRAGAVSLAERADAGGPSRVEPRPAAPGLRPDSGWPTWASWLALAALLAAAVAFRPAALGRPLPPGAQ